MVVHLFHKPFVLLKIRIINVTMGKTRHSKYDTIVILCLRSLRYSPHMKSVKRRYKFMYDSWFRDAPLMLFPIGKLSSYHRKMTLRLCHGHVVIYISPVLRNSVMILCLMLVLLIQINQHSFLETDKNMKCYVFCLVLISLWWIGGQMAHIIITLHARISLVGCKRRAIFHVP